MTEQQKKHVASTVRGLYPYPYRTKGENVLRGGVWMASWIIGIVVQNGVSQQAIGGAYFIYSVSLLLEYVPESKRDIIAKAVHGFFCMLLLFLLFGSLLLIFESTVFSIPVFGKYDLDLMDVLLIIGWLVFGMLLAGVLLVIGEVHKWFYDDEKENEHETEAQRETYRKTFNDNLNGPAKGGNTE